MLGDDCTNEIYTLGYCKCMYVCMCMYVLYACMHKYAFMYVCMYRTSRSDIAGFRAQGLYVYMYVCMYVCLYVCVSVCAPRLEVLYGVAGV